MCICIQNQVNRFFVFEIYFNFKPKYQMHYIDVMAKDFKFGMSLKV